MLNRYLIHMLNAARRWFKFENMGPSPLGRSYHAMVSDGTRVFVLGGHSAGVRADGISLIHGFDTSMYFRYVISSEPPTILRMQMTSSTRDLSIMLTIL